MKSFAEFIDEAVLGAEHYRWRTYDHPEPLSLNHRGNEHQLNHGDEFGIRQAHSDPMKKRLVMKKHGLTKVFSLPPDAARFIASRSKG